MRRAAAGALAGQAGEQAVRDALLKRLDGDDDAVRGAAAWALERSILSDKFGIEP